MVKKCPNCNTKNKDVSNFCISCGVSFSAPAEVPEYPPPQPPPIEEESEEIEFTPSEVTPTPKEEAPETPSLGMCHYHPDLEAESVCNICGKSLCRDDAKTYHDLTVCPQCLSTVPPLPPSPPPPKPSPQKKSLWGFITSLTAGILIFVNTAALLFESTYTLLHSIFPWIVFFEDFPLWILVVGGIALGVIVFLGAVSIIFGYETVGSILVLTAAVISLILGGGFIAGFVLGIAGGILGILKK